MPHAEEVPEAEWISTGTAAAILNRSKRRTLELIREHKLGTRTEMNGRAEVQLVDAAAIRKLRADRDKPKPATIDVGELQLARRADRRQQPPTEWLAEVLAPLLQRRDERRDEPKPYQWVTLTQAARLVGLSKAALELACEEGRLQSRWDGSPSQQRRMVKVEELFALR